MRRGKRLIGVRQTHFRRLKAYEDEKSCAKVLRSVCDSDYAGSGGYFDGFQSGGDGSGVLNVDEGEAKAPPVNRRRKGRASLLAWLEIASSCCKSSGCVGQKDVGGTGAGGGGGNRGNENNREADINSPQLHLRRRPDSPDTPLPAVYTTTKTTAGISRS